MINLGIDRLLDRFHPLRANEIAHENPRFINNFTLNQGVMLQELQP